MLINCHTVIVSSLSAKRNCYTSQHFWWDTPREESITGCESRQNIYCYFPVWAAGRHGQQVWREKNTATRLTTHTSQYSFVSFHFAILSNCLDWHLKYKVWVWVLHCLMTPCCFLFVVYVYCISHVWLLLQGQWTVLYWGIGFQSTPPLEGAGVFNVPEGDSPQNTEPPFIAWFELLVSQTRSLASIMLDFSCGALQRWL